jgi:hypothetical protein
MNVPEFLKTLLQVPELATVGNPQERAAFVALYIDGRTVRDAGKAIGIGKSNVKNLADLFQAKLRKTIVEMRKKRGCTWSREYQRLETDLLELMPPDDFEGGHKIGNFEPSNMSQEDRAEAMGWGSPRVDDE